MNFDMNSKRSVHNRGPAQPAAAQQPGPAVPISVYRELAAELQATQTMLDSLHAQNRHLRKTNQHMQFELDQIIESAQKMQQISAPPPSTVDVSLKRASGQNGDGGFAHSPAQHLSQPASAMPPEAIEAPVRPRPKARKPPTSPPRQAAVETLNQLFTGREVSRSRPKLSPDGPRELSTWWLVVMVLFIVVTAFGTGFMLVRPFLDPSPSQPPSQLPAQPQF